jgi:hypothetical protein
MRSLAVPLAAILLLSSCAQPTAPKPERRPVLLPAPSADAAAPADLPGLTNVVTFTPGLVTGSAPETDAAFDTLRDMGVSTIISVDGATPQVASARARGMRSIHLPIGYNGMDEARTLQIAKAVQMGNLTGVVYLHCHHGMHRAPAAAAAAAVTLGDLTNAQAAHKLELAGTSPSYPGLFQCVQAAHAVNPKTVEALPDDFPETARTSGIVQAMVQIDETVDHLKTIQAAGWAVPPDHPDLAPAAEAGRLADLFRVLRDDKEAHAKPPEFRDRLAAIADDAARLEALLAAGRPVPGTQRSASDRFETVAKACNDCHAKYRN